MTVKCRRFLQNIQPINLVGLRKAYLDFHVKNHDHVEIAKLGGYNPRIESDISGRA
jgi:hypothetical protein